MKRAIILCTMLLWHWHSMLALSLFEDSASQVTYLQVLGQDQINWSNVKGTELVMLQEFDAFLALAMHPNTNHRQQYEALNESATKHYQALSKTNPLRAYLMSRSELQQSIIALQNADYISAVKDLRDAIQHTNKGLKIQSDYKPLVLQNALIQVLVGSVPKEYKPWLKLLGIHGDDATGLALFDLLLVEQHSAEWWYAEACIYKQLIEFHLLERQWEWRSTPLLTQWNSMPLGQFYRAYWYIHTGRAPEVIPVLQQLSGQDWPLVRYYLGLAHAYNLSADAQEHLQWYASNGYMEPNRKKALKVSIWLARYHHDQELIESTEAMWQLRYPKEALETSPSKTLLAARLLFDGGQYEAALEQLKTVKAVEKKAIPFQVEYFYRLGRTEAEMGYSLHFMALKECVRLYDSVAVSYYGPMAALHLAYWCQSGQSFERPDEWFDKVLSYKNYPHEHAIRRKAKNRDAMKRRP